MTAGATNGTGPGGRDTACLLLDIPASGNYLGLTVWQVRGLISSGELHVVQVGRKLYLRRQTLSRWAEKTEGKHRV